MSKKRLKLELEQSPTQESTRFLVREMVAFNERHHPGAQGVLLGAALRDPEGEMVAGALGSTQWGWLHISHLWVPDELRGQGWGRRLMAAMEKAALARGCHAAYVDTFSFQARGFYEKLGYELFATLPDFPEGDSLQFLQKRLAPTPLVGVTGARRP
ncbi:MAG: GNAT family N-acetyltransferase [Myxococcaceae bacterium]|nr:GNAT family N-acetyltransferase [Myxococcaceae bacterium]MCI0669781.1 GNAT family N-acetyltransferase [Myxococcaceae bacterium]